MQKNKAKLGLLKRLKSAISVVLCRAFFWAMPSFKKFSKQTPRKIVFFEE